MKLEIQDYYTIVYLLGWVVVCVGVYMVMSNGMTPGSHDNTGLGVMFGGLYMTAFVRNSQLKLKLTLLEREIDDK